MRYLCLDPGRKRIGVAVSDETGLIATPLGVINVTGREQAIKEVLAYLEREEAGRLVIGLPLHMNGDEGVEAARAREFAAQLARRTPIPIDFMDERWTSVEAERILVERGKKRRTSRQRLTVDAHAAAIILQTYLDAERERNRRPG